MHLHLHLYGLECVCSLCCVHSHSADSSYVSPRAVVMLSFVLWCQVKYLCEPLHQFYALQILDCQLFIELCILSESINVLLIKFLVFKSSTMVTTVRIMKTLSCIGRNWTYFWSSDLLKLWYWLYFQLGNPKWWRIKKCGDKCQCYINLGWSGNLRFCAF